MRANGTLKYLTLTESDLNDYGEISGSASQEWSDAIPCSIKVNSDTRKGTYEDGEFRQASYVILIELSQFNAERIKIERLGEDLGEHRVLSVEPLISVGRVQILV